eukprot:COSAG02_NODE_649_length_18914_cov_30.645868_8_plen_104_part_00
MRDGRGGCGSSWRQVQHAGLSFLAEAVVRVGRSVLTARGCAGCRGSGRTGSEGCERAGCVGELHLQPDCWVIRDWFQDVQITGIDSPGDQADDGTAALAGGGR